MQQHIQQALTPLHVKRFKATPLDGWRLSGWCITMVSHRRTPPTLTFSHNSLLLNCKYAGKSIPVTLQRFSPSGLQEMWQWALEGLQSHRDRKLPQWFLSPQTCTVRSFVCSTDKHNRGQSEAREISNCIADDCEPHVSKCVDNVQENKLWSNISTWWRSMPSTLKERFLWR